MVEKWVEKTKRADFKEWGRELSVLPITARLIRNRGPETLEEAREYLYGTMDSLADPLLMKDMKKGADILEAAVRSGAGIAVVSDFDDDGIFSGQILLEGLRAVGGRVKVFTPERVREGYGINARIIDEAKARGFRVILTCDNGIAAVSETAYAKSLGLTVVITDHHEPQELIPAADAVIDPKQADCAYPFKSLCGAGVALRLIGVLYPRFGIPKERETELYEYAAIATVADVVELQGENRILVREGLKLLRNTKKPGLRALMDVCGIDPGSLKASHIGFQLGPCFNAAGRLATVSLPFELLSARDPEEAHALAQRLWDLNAERKRMTEEGVRMAEEILKARDLRDEKVLTVRLHGVHESLVGIIAGRLREAYGLPAFVFTESGELLKASGRSVPGYHMLGHLIPEKDLLERFGGHAMAAGLSIRPENYGLLQKRLNEDCSMAKEELIPKRELDARLPLTAVSERMIREMELLEPFGQGNPRPEFAWAHFRIHDLRILGSAGKVCRMVISDESLTRMEAVLFGEAKIRDFLEFLTREFGEEEVEKAKRGADNALDAAFAFVPGFNEYRGLRSIQIRVDGSCRIR